MPPERETAPTDSAQNEETPDPSETAPMKVTVTNNASVVKETAEKGGGELLENGANGGDSGVESDTGAKVNGESVETAEASRKDKTEDVEKVENPLDENRDSVLDDNKSDTSSKSNRTNKSVRFQMSAADGSYSPRAMKLHGEITSSGSVCDGFYVLPTGVPMSPQQWAESNRSPSVQSMSSSVSILSPNGKTAASMRTRGPLSMSRQISGRYFPLRAMTRNQKEVLGPVEIRPIIRDPDRESRPSTRQPRPRTRTGSKNSNASSNNSSFHIPSRNSTFPRDIGRRMLQRDTQYNKLKSSFWNGQDSHRSTQINSLDQVPNGFDASRIYQRDFFTVKHVSILPKRSHSVPRSRTSGFEGCLEGNMKRIHERPNTSFPYV